MVRPHTRAVYPPILVSIPGDALVTVVRAGRLLQDAGDKDGTIALYENFIETMKTCELTPIERLEYCVPVPDPVHPGKNMLEFSLVRSHPARYSLA